MSKPRFGSYSEFESDSHADGYFSVSSKSAGRCGHGMRWKEKNFIVDSSAGTVDHLQVPTRAILVAYCFRCIHRLPKRGHDVPRDPLHRLQHQSMVHAAE